MKLFQETPMFVHRSYEKIETQLIPSITYPVTIQQEIFKIPGDEQVVVSPLYRMLDKGDYSGPNYQYWFSDQVGFPVREQDIVFVSLTPEQEAELLEVELSL